MGSESGRVRSVIQRLWSRVADAYWEVRYRLNPPPPIAPDRATRLLARIDQGLAANRDKAAGFLVCDDPNCQPYGEHFRRLHGKDQP